MLTGWTPRDPSVRERHKKPREELGYLRLSRPEVGLEVWGTTNNPIRMGLSGGRPDTTSLEATLRRLWGMSGVRKQFRSQGQCSHCRARGGKGSRATRMLNGAGNCLRHAWMLQEGLLGVVIQGSGRTFNSYYQR